MKLQELKDKLREVANKHRRLGTARELADAFSPEDMTGQLVSILVNGEYAQCTVDLLGKVLANNLTLIQTDFISACAELNLDPESFDENEARHDAN